MTLADIRRALDVIDAAIPKLAAGAAELDRRARISSRRDGYPTRASGAQAPAIVLHTALRDPEEASAVDYSDPTPGAALTGFQRPDDVSQRHSRYEREIHRAARALTIAIAQLKEPTDYDEGHRWCWSCARVKHDDGTPHLNPPWSRIKGKTDVNGRLPEPRDLCRVCHEHVQIEGVLPSVAFCTEYLTRGRAPRKSA